MSEVTLRGNPIQVVGDFPQPGQQAKPFRLVNGDLADIELSAYAGKRKVLNIFPSVDTPTCATSVRKFNSQASSLQNTVVLCISADLPFAQKRFCGPKGWITWSTCRPCAAANSWSTTAWRSPTARWQESLPVPW